MINIINNYIILRFVKIFFNVLIAFVFLSLILTLFEELEFFKTLNVSKGLPLFLTLLYVPNLSINFLPFVIFLSSMIYFVSIKQNTDLISLKVFGYSNLKIVLILSFTCFILGFLVLVTLNPITSNMIKYYEDIKSRHSRDVEHLFTITRNGVWIKEHNLNQTKIISAKSLIDEKLNNLTIFEMNEEDLLVKRIEAKSADITSNNWVLEDVKIYDLTKDEVELIKKTKTEYFSIYDKEKINLLYKNLDTISFFTLILDYDELRDQGYPKKLLFQKLNSFLSLPIYLFLMVFLASIFTLGSLVKSQNFYYIFVAIFTCVIIFFLKNLSFSLGETNKVSDVLAIWIPIILISLFCFIGIIQINEK